MLLGKTWETITFVDLDRFVNESFQEGIRLDFNREFPKKTQSDPENPKTSNVDDWIGVCKVAAAFANTKGGILAFGIREEKGVATEIEGIEIDNWEKLREKIIQKLRNNISSPLFDPYLFNIPLPSGRSVVIMEVAPSLRAPHFVRISTGINVFYKRVEARIIDMNIEEIQEAFLKRKEWVKEAEILRTKRMELSFSEDAGPFALTPPAFFFHLIPLGPRDSILQFGNDEIRREFVDAVTTFEKNNGGSLFHSPEKLCFEGLLFRRELSDQYIQHLVIQRNGMIEFAGYCGNFQDDALAQVDWEKLGLDCFAHLIPTLLKYEIYSPFLLCYSLLGVKNLRLQLQYPNLMTAGHTSHIGLSRDKYHLPAVTIDSLPSTDKKELLACLQKLYQPFFDMIWNDINKAYSPNALV